LFTVLAQALRAAGEPRLVGVVTGRGEGERSLGARSVPGFPVPRPSTPAVMDDASAVHDFLIILEEHRKNCEKAGKYIEADVAKKRLEELRQHEENRRQEGLRSRQIAQRLGVEEAHMLEFQQFNAAWDRKTKEYEERASELLEAMRQRHLLDVQDFKRKAASEPQRSPKFSKELLDLRRIEVTLAKQGEYVEAQKVKVHADSLEAAERERMQAEREQHVSVLEVKFIQKQEQEVNALRQRIQAGAEEQRKARQVDLERLLQRYHNVKAELEAQQNVERLRQRKCTTASGAATLSSSASSSVRLNKSSTSSARPSSARPRRPEQ